MKTIFEKDNYDEVIERIDRLTPNAERQWGKMTPTQMMEHCARALEMASGKKAVKQMFIGKAIGWIFKPGFLGEKPMPRNAPTGAWLKIEDDPEFESTREKLKRSMTEFHDLGESGTDGNVHGFFGRLTGKQWGETQYKHLDHHLRQFGV